MNAKATTNSETMVSLKDRVDSSRLVSGNLTPHAEPPSRALVELTNGCNHACIFCKNSNQSRRANHLPLATFTSFVHQAVELGLQEVGLYATGEPFMSRQLVDYIEVAKQSGVKRVYLTSNGALATVEKVKACYAAGLDSIKYSINASNSSDYELVHGFNDFDKVVQNVKDTVAWKRESGIRLEMLCSCVIIPAVGDIEEEHRAMFSDFFDDLLYIKSGSQGGQAFELIEELGVSPHGVFGNIEQPNSAESIKPCSLVWNRYHLTAEGYLTACCVDYELDLVIANLNQQNLSEGWNNDNAIKLRTAHLEKKLDGLLCNQCLQNRKLPYEPLTIVPKTQKPNQLREKELERLKGRMVYTLKLKK